MRNEVSIPILAACLAAAGCLMASTGASAEGSSGSPNPCSVNGNDKCVFDIHVDTTGRSCKVKVEHKYMAVVTTPGNGDYTVKWKLDNADFVFAPDGIRIITALSSADNPWKDDGKAKGQAFTQSIKSGARKFDAGDNGPIRFTIKVVEKNNPNNACAVDPIIGNGAN